MNDRQITGDPHTERGPERAGVGPRARHVPSAHPGDGKESLSPRQLPHF